MARKLRSMSAAALQPDAAGRARRGPATRWTSSARLARCAGCAAGPRPPRRWPPDVAPPRSSSRPPCTARPRSPRRWTPSCFAPADRRMLLVSQQRGDARDDARRWTRCPASSALRGRFDEVHLVERDHQPLPPGRLGPAAGRRTAVGAASAAAWGLGDDDVELAVESIQVNPALGARPDLHRRAHHRLRRRPDELRPHPQQDRPAGRHPGAAGCSTWTWCRA